MIKLKIDLDKKNNLIVKVGLKNINKNDRLLKRFLFEAKVLKNDKIYNYEIPSNLLIPFVNILKSKYEFKIYKGNIETFFEFSDEYDEVYYYCKTPKFNYMKKWRVVNCPKIYKITIDLTNNEIIKRVAFSLNKVILK